MQNCLYPVYLQQLAGLRDLVTHENFVLIGANSADGLRASAAPAARYPARESSRGCHLFAASASDWRPCWPFGMGVLSSIVGGWRCAHRL